ncbi:hypothetical protein LINGRAHAP2_LOCUS10807 [Linum grandiflorum]
MDASVDADTSRAPVVRGPAKKRDKGLWDINVKNTRLKDGNRLVVQLPNGVLPGGLDTLEFLNRYLGVLAKDFKLFPIRFPDWRDSELKPIKDYVWRTLIEASVEQNKKNKAVQLVNHKGGAKLVAAIQAAYEQELGYVPSRGQMWFCTYKKKDGTIPESALRFADLLKKYEAMEGIPKTHGPGDSYDLAYMEYDPKYTGEHSRRVRLKSFGYTPRLLIIRISIGVVCPPVDVEATIRAHVQEEVSDQEINLEEEDNPDDYILEPHEYLHPALHCTANDDVNDEGNGESSMEYNEDSDDDDDDDDDDS